MWRAVLVYTNLPSIVEAVQAERFCALLYWKNCPIIPHRPHQAASIREE